VAVSLGADGVLVGQRAHSAVVIEAGLRIPKFSSFIEFNARLDAGRRLASKASGAVACFAILAAFFIVSPATEGVWKRPIRSLGAE
jgi:carbamoylphosphate synthase large subunit